MDHTVEWTRAERTVQQARDHLADTIRDFERYNEYPDEHDRGYIGGLKRALAILNESESLGPRYSSLYFARMPRENVKTVVD